MNKKILMALVAFLLVIATVLSVALSCSNAPQDVEKQSEADSLLNAAYNATDYERVIVLADSLEKTGNISPFKSAFYRAISYKSQGDYRHTEEILKPVMDMTPATSQDSAYYIECLWRMAEMLNIKEDYEGVLRIGLPLIEKLKGTEGKNAPTLGRLSQFVGSAQLSLGMKEDAAKSFEMSYNFILEQSEAEPTLQNIASVFAIGYNIYTKYIGIGDCEGAMKWYHRQDSVLSLISERNDVPASMLDQFVAGNCIAHAMLAIGQKNTAEVNRAIVNYMKTERSKTLGGQIDGAELLLHAERYAEAADAYALLDQFFAEFNMEASLDNLNQYMVGKFEANYKADRRDSALAVAAYIAEHLDSAFIKQKKSDAAELATVYQTQQKDAEIARQQISLSRQRWIGTLVTLILLLVFFVVYTEYRRRAANRLAAAHVKLQDAYNQLEETTAAKERIESELRIARDIQMSMVPGVFPKYKGLDMYAEMTPAKEVGGDLYGYVMQGDNLYFCVGDVSGKGVPASLFMAQSARLFRTLAAEGMMPANIATRMNNELVEGNDRNMFVTMFIGLLHLDTGRLDFCNCGHNAPVYDGQFLKMQYVNQMIGVLEGREPADGTAWQRAALGTDG